LFYRRKQILEIYLYRTAAGTGILARAVYSARVWVKHLYFAAAERNGADSRSAAGERAVREELNRQAEDILKNYGGSILRLAYTYLHNMSDAEDILQETLIRFLKAAPVFENGEHEKAWMLRVAANLSKNRIEYNRLRSTDELEESLIAEDREDLSFVWEAVRDLPDKFREVIHLYYYEGYKTAQIARILERKEATVRSDLRRGREKLREILREVYDFEEGV
jgi:RNA polymerase sigma factor (sigma-70 family)